MILWAARKLSGMARMVEKSVASRPMAMVSISLPATYMVGVLSRGAKPRLHIHAGRRRWPDPPEDIEHIVADSDAALGRAPGELVADGLRSHRPRCRSCLRPSIVMVSTSGLTRSVATSLASLEAGDQPVQLDIGHVPGDHVQDDRGQQYPEQGVEPFARWPDWRASSTFHTQNRINGSHSQLVTSPPSLPGQSYCCPTPS